jgi:hypothetical protein
MKTIIAFIAPVLAMLAKAGYDVDKVINACQSDANSAKGREGATKRSDFKGGHSYKSDGTMEVKPLTFGESTKVEYTIEKPTAPGELIKWHDSLAAHFKKTGAPSGNLTADLLPGYVRSWLDLKMKIGRVELPSGEVHKGNGNGNGKGKARTGNGVSPDIKPVVPASV